MPPALMNQSIYLEKKKPESVVRKIAATVIDRFSEDIILRCICGQRYLCNKNAFEGDHFTSLLLGTLMWLRGPGSGCCGSGDIARNDSAIIIIYPSEVKYGVHGKNVEEVGVGANEDAGPDSDRKFETAVVKSRRGTDYDAEFSDGSHVVVPRSVSSHAVRRIEFQPGDLVKLTLDDSRTVWKCEPWLEHWPEATLNSSEVSYEGKVALLTEEQLELVRSFPTCLNVTVIKTSSPESDENWRAIELKRLLRKSCEGKSSGILENTYHEEIHVNSGLSFGRVALGEKSKPLDIKIENVAEHENTLMDIIVDVGDIVVIEGIKRPFLPIHLKPKEAKFFAVHCDMTGDRLPPNDLGGIIFKFSRFSIYRTLRAQFDSADSPYHNEIFGNPLEKTRIISCQKKAGPRRFTHFLPYNIDQNLVKAVFNGLPIDPYVSFGKLLNIDSYRSHLEGLVYLEEIHERQIFDQHKLENVRLVKEVPANFLLDLYEILRSKEDQTFGFLDDRCGKTEDKCNHADESNLRSEMGSSGLVKLLRKGMKVVVSSAIQRGADQHNGGKQFEGEVIKIEDLRLHLKFNDEFHRSVSQSTRVNVRFLEQLASYKRKHHAIQIAVPQLGAEVLFPVSSTTDYEPVLDLHDDKTMRPTYCPRFCQTDGEGSVTMFTPEEEDKGRYTIRWFNHDLNDGQRLAVMNMFMSSTRAPYLLFGPPGTGKTVTIVEAIMQTFHMLPSSRILVALPSNTAADQICSGLAVYVQRGWLRKSSMIRFLSKTREITYLPRECEEFVLLNENDTSDATDVKLQDARIVIGTWFMCGSLIVKCPSNRFFTHVFVDEAGHLTEPEVLVPLSVSSKLTRIVLCGDPQQLSPVILSPLAKQKQLGTSLMERLMNTQDVYKKSSAAPGNAVYDPKYVTQLVLNYRSHEMILSLYSNLAYGGLLKAAYQPDDNLDWVPQEYKKYYPFLVYAVRDGVVSKSKTSPSPSNAAEARVVERVAKAFMRTEHIREEDIGIVTPYRRQCHEIRTRLQEHQKIKVGTVEEFQGTERKIIIVSLVRTKKNVSWKYSGFWENSFFASKKHTNVAISRAKSFLIIVGDPGLMEMDENWRQLLAVARSNELKHMLDSPVRR
ncbi:unnamed protein product [Notodromas monacha]|uniref:RNA helicase n=1 Tax=Notodromas monacha TaxID=399045 RepID=A0A7R9BP87_9CRUS|nr:unnamed protein product [Notodromas monacha]CAG0919122.1 unnamed protein product [Notodromas monacha]